MKQTYLTYALNAEGKLVHIDSVPNGKACGCFCTFCGEALQAKQGAKRKHHFSHLSKTECEAAYESMLHLLAKEKIQEAFYKSTSFFIEFEYSSFCSQEKCIFMRNSDRCCEKERKRFDVKQWYDSCEQEISYDNIRRRSDLKFYSKEFPERKPIYIEFCVTHASDEAKLHSGNKIIEILIDDEERISSLIESGLVEKSETIGEEWEGRKIKIVAFYGFKTKDYNNSTMSEDVGFTRSVLMPSGKIYISSEHCSCKQIGRKDHRALCEIVFSLFYQYEAYNYAYSICSQKYHISNCNSCRNYVNVTPWYDVGYKMCKMYKLLQLPFVDFKTPGMFDTSMAQSCRFYSQVNVVLDEEIEYLIL